MLRKRATIVRVKRFNEMVFFESNELRLLVEVTSLWHAKKWFSCCKNFLRDKKKQRTRSSLHNRFCQRRVWSHWCFVVTFLLMFVLYKPCICLSRIKASIGNSTSWRKWISWKNMRGTYFDVLFFQLSVMHFNYLARLIIIIIFDNYNHLFMLWVKLEWLSINCSNSFRQIDASEKFCDDWKRKQSRG